MASVSFQLAGPPDDADLRRLLRESPVPGAVTLTFEREPSYFAAARVEGPFHQTILARAEASGAVVGMASRSVGPRWVNGAVQPVGYLSHLRASPRYAWGAGAAAVLGRAFAFVRTLHADGRAPFYLFSVIARSGPAERLLTSSRRDFPLLRPVGRLVTYALLVGRRRVVAPPSGIRLARGDAARWPDVAACLARHGARHLLAPAWTADELAGRCRPGNRSDEDPAAAGPGPGGLPGLTAGDFWLASRGAAVVGCLARWDQGALKQTVVRGYSGLLAHARPVVNAVGRVAGWPALPAVGTPLRSAYASHAAVDGDEPGVFAALLGALYNDAVARGDHFLLLGLPDGHPWQRVARAYRHIAYPSQLYAAAWDRSALAGLDEGGAWPEIALL